MTYSKIISFQMNAYEMEKVCLGACKKQKILQ